jgi:hypothetical protein
MREAIDLLLAQSEAQETVWLLLENNPGLLGHVLDVFASPALAMEAHRIKKVIRAGTWEERTPGLWICQLSGDKDFYFSMEDWQVDR